MATTDYETVHQLAKLLRPIDKVQLIAALSLDLVGELGAAKASVESASGHREPRESLYGIAAHLGPAPSAEDIDEVRREMWSNFARDDL